MKKILLSLIFCLFVNNFYTHTEEWTVLNTSNSDIPFDEITSILQISNGNLYVGSDSSSLGIFSEIFAFYDGKNWVYISPWNPPSSINYTIKFEGILQASNGDVYASVQTMYSSENCGLARYTGHQWIIYDTSNSGLPLCSINSIVESNDGDIYIGTRLKGVIKFDGINWTIFNSSNSG
ncbi:MAG: two-component regulator propeller domain-containing protein, partial [Cyclobacteriaceae bacterium]